ncbi:MAG TPA: hypothetical protein VFA34_04905 [Actinomycetota bacterium]|nr:hypothetical protein [Actinomycetota bacterium]
MTESESRVQAALAAYIEHAEIGGPEPDTSHLSAGELERLRDLIGLLDQTDGIAFGGGERREPSATTAAGAQVIAALRDTLPAPARVTSDPAVAMIAIPGMNVAEGWIVGTFGGRVRVWLLGDEGALEASDRWLEDLARVFRLFPDTAALTLVEPDLSSLLVQPEDCAPTIEVPRGSLVGRRYRRPVHPVGEALSVFLRELIPYWEPMRGISEQSAGTIVDVPPIAQELADKAIEAQVTAGGRARKTNPKRKALTELDDTHAREIARVVLDVHEGRSEPEDVSDVLRRMAASK